MADTISDTLQSIDTTLRHIERMLVKNVCRFEPKIENLELSDPMAAEKLLWAFEKDEKTGNVTIVPMNGEQIVIHGKTEAEMFCSILTQCFQ